MSIFHRSEARRFERLPCLKYYNVLEFKGCSIKIDTLDLEHMEGGGRMGIQNQPGGNTGSETTCLPREPTSTCDNSILMRIQQ